MKDVKALVNKAVNQIKTKEIDKGSMAFIDDVFIVLKRMFPAWRNTILNESEEADIKKEWVKALIQEGVTNMEDIERGVAKARANDSPFWPSVGIFIKWCKKEVPRINEAMYREHSMLKKLPRHTKEEYADMAKKGADKCRAALKK